MKRISTRIFQLSLLSVLLSTAVSASADEYKSMIRYDRVWEYLNIHWNDMQVYHVKFDGQEEINGKTYHRLVAFRKASFSYEYDDQLSLFDIDNDYYDHEGYLREEDGKVYTLIVNDGQDPAYQGLSIYTPDFSYPDSSTIEEKLIYDFTCKEGDIYTGMQVEDCWGMQYDYKV